MSIMKQSYYTQTNIGTTLVSPTTGTITVTPGSGTQWVHYNPNGISGHYTYKPSESFKIRIPKNCTLEEKVDFLMEFVSGSIGNIQQTIDETKYNSLEKKYKKFFINTNATESEKKAANVKESLEII